MCRNIPKQALAALTLLGLLACADTTDPVEPDVRLQPDAPAADAIPLNGRLITDDQDYDFRPGIDGDWVVWEAQVLQDGRNDRLIHGLNTATGETFAVDIDRFEMGYDAGNPKLLWPHIDGNRVVFDIILGGRADIGLYDISTRTTELIYRVPAGFGRAAFQLGISGDRLVWAENRDEGTSFDIYMLDLVTGVETRLTDDPASQTDPVISGDWVAFMDRRNATMDIYAHNVVTGEERLLTDQTAHDKRPSISGTRVAWQYTTSSNQTDVYVHDLATGETVAVVATVHAQEFPDIDGDLVVWGDSRSTTHSSEIFLCNVVTGEEAQLTDVPHAQMLPMVGDGRVVWADSREDDTGNRDWDIYLAEGYTPTGTCTPLSIPEPEPEPDNQPPIADAGGPYASDEGASVRFDGGGSEDPDDDELTYAWSFGDPAAEDGGSGPGVAPTHTYVDDGTFTVTLVVTDPEGLRDDATATVEVANVAPAVDPLPDATILEGTEYAAGGSFSDPGADSWTAAADYGDGTAPEPLALDGKTFDLAYVYWLPGTFTVTTTVTDDDGGSGQGTGTVVVEPVNLGGEGCTPGYWRQPHHYDAWRAPYFTPETPFDAVFADAFAGETLGDVVRARGGQINALGRHAVAALLNAASLDVSYGLSLPDVIDAFDAAVAAGDRRLVEDTKNTLEALNEAGCPLEGGDTPRASTAGGDVGTE